MTGNKKLDNILIILMFLATSSVAGLFYYTEFIYKKPTVNEEIESKELLNSQDIRSIPQFFKIDKMVISLVPESGPLNARMRWLELEVHMVLFESSDEPYLKENMAIIKDSIIEISSNMGAKDLNSISGKIILEDRIKRDLNKKLLRPVVKNVFFTNFIVQ